MRAPLLPVNVQVSQETLYAIEKACSSGAGASSSDASTAGETLMEALGR